jgi:hypothetical protein
MAVLPIDFILICLQTLFEAGTLFTCSKLFQLKRISE